MVTIKRTKQREIWDIEARISDIKRNFRSNELKIKELQVKNVGIEKEIFKLRAIAGLKRCELKRWVNESTGRVEGLRD